MKKDTLGGNIADGLIIFAVTLFFGAIAFGLWELGAKIISLL